MVQGIFGFVGSLRDLFLLLIFASIRSSWSLEMPSTPPGHHTKAFRAKKRAVPEWASVVDPRGGGGVLGVQISALHQTREIFSNLTWTICFQAEIDSTPDDCVLSLVENNV